MGKKSVEITGISTSSIKVLSHSEMLELFKEYQNGDLSAKEKLVNGNLKLVLSILRKYNRRVDNLDDLFQIGVVGLIKAVDNFDLKHEVKFSTYAVLMIEGEIKRYIRDNNSLRISRSIKDLAYRVLLFKEEYIQENGKEPSTEEIAKNLNVSNYDVVEALLSLKEPDSLYEPIYNDGGDTIYLMDQIEDKKENKDIDSLISMRKALNKIKERERNILISRFIVGKTQMEIANELMISQAQVSRLEKNAIKNVKRLIK
ncbi:MAG: sigma-70 family RNA polymerase sigma factor [Tenericutes bacterium]|nr:sigma-70 family RNA polymerase sigma factor [Mycoplasmatota bacterium]